MSRNFRSQQRKGYKAVTCDEERVRGHDTQYDGKPSCSPEELSGYPNRRPAVKSIRLHGSFLALSPTRFRSLEFFLAPGFGKKTLRFSLEGLFTYEEAQNEKEAGQLVHLFSNRTPRSRDVAPRLAFRGKCPRHLWRFSKAPVAGK